MSNKRRSAGDKKRGGLLPISSLGSRHCSGVVTGGTVACTTDVLVRARLHAWEGLLRQASLGALSRHRVSYGDRDDSPCVGIKNLLSRQGVRQ